MPGKYPDRIRSLPLFDGQFDAYRLKAEGADVLFASYDAGTDIASHSHDTDNYGVITRGALELTMDGETTTYRAGDWYHVPASRLHSARFPEATDEIEIWFATKP
ncbi:MAG: cupin domain-containing protein [Woeseiaceae bacterium]